MNNKEHFRRCCNCRKPICWEKGEYKSKVLKSYATICCQCLEELESKLHKIKIILSSQPKDDEK